MKSQNSYGQLRNASSQQTAPALPYPGIYLKAIIGGKAKKGSGLTEKETACQQRKLAEAMVLGQEKERTRLGHELHDNVNQILAVSKLFLGMVKPGDDESNALKRKVGEYLDSAVNEIRNLSHGLVVPNFNKTGLVGSFNKILNDIAMVNAFEIAFDYDEKIELLDDSKKITLLRILQEQIKNIIKYSRATKVNVELCLVRNKALLRIRDNGVGFDARVSRRGIGLSNIYDRIELYNGSVNLETAPGKGCDLSVTLPAKNK
jgi:signal transduction histidine kinase